MHCSSCRAALPEKARFCMACGAPVLQTCSACGHSNPREARYCVECGASLVAHTTGDTSTAPLVAMEPPPAAPQRALPERRHLTVLFCDLVGSTALSIRLDPEDLSEVIGAFHRCVADTVLRFDGFVARYMGDGALVYFGYPHAHEDNAERAVRAGMALMSEHRQARAFAASGCPRASASEPASSSWARW